MFSHVVALGAQHLRHIALVFLLVVAGSAARPALAFDPLQTEGQLPSQDGGLMGAGTDQCALTANRSPKSVSLYEAVSMSLCSDPQTRQAWAGIRVQAAQVGQARGAFLPTLNGTIEYARDHSETDVPADYTLNTNFKNRIKTNTLNLSWVLFDFGARNSELENANQMLIAAEAEHASKLQQVFANTAKDYYSAAAANASVKATQEIEDAARLSLEAATGRVKGGVAALSDQLQTQTAYAQAVFNHAKAKGEYLAALGTLSLDMGISPASPIELTEQMDAPMADVSFVHAVDVLLDEAKASNPAIRQAQAQLDAAIAKSHSAMAESMPSISLSGRISHNTQPLSLGAGMGEVDANNHDRYIGVQLSVPLFAGFSNVYKIKGALAQIEVQKDALLDARQQVAQQVWTSYQTFLTDTENLHNTETILSSARMQFTAAQERYHRGVAGILELMTAQSTLSDALQQRIRSLADWRTARLQLAGSIGKLGAWALN